MKTSSPVALVVAVAAFAACSDGTSSAPSLVSDADITADVAASAGDAVIATLDEMRATEQAGTLAGASAIQAPSLVSASRTITCYDAADVVVPDCSPRSSVRKIVSHAELTGSRSGTRERTGGGTVSWSGSVNRVADDTVTRNFDSSDPPVELSRTHDNFVVVHDTTTFAADDVSRVMTEAARDTVNSVTWNLPRSENPFPVSGSIVRTDSIKVVATRGDATQTRELVRRIEITFPADAQGNVVLTINDKTCSLNLVSRRVSNCQ